MEVLSYGEKKSREDHLRASVIAYCHGRARCLGCPLRYPICRKGNTYRLISEWSEGEVKMAVSLLGEER